jgi:hypothetical protein
MLNERLNAARPIAEKIKAAEKSATDTLALVGTLLAEIPAVRTKFAGRLPLEAGADACERLAQAAVSASQVYRQVIEAHAFLSEDRSRMGLDIVNWGDFDDCPPSKPSADSKPTHIQIAKVA